MQPIELMEPTEDSLENEGPSLDGVLSLLPEPFATFTWVRNSDGSAVAARVTTANPAAQALGIVPGSEWTEQVAGLVGLDRDACEMDGSWPVAGTPADVKAWRIPAGFAALWRTPPPVRPRHRPPAQTEAVYEAMDEGVAVFDSSGRQIWHNRAQARHFGFAETDDLSGDLAEFSRRFELWTLDGTPLPVEEWPAARVLRGETLADLELRVRRSDIGKTWIVTFSGKPVADASGGPPLAVIISRNVTERHATRAALARSEERYRTLFNSIEDGFCIVEILFEPHGRPRDYRILEGNPAYAEATGLKDSVGRTVLELVPTIEPFWIETYGRVAQTGEPVRFERHVAAWNRWFEVYAFRFGAAPTNQVAIFFRNITERKHAQEARELTLQRLQLAQEVGRIGSFEWNITRNVNEWSPELEILYGIAPGSFGGSYADWLALVHPDDRQAAEAAARQALVTGSLEAEWRVIRPDGQVRWMAARARVHFDEHGRPLRMIGLHIDDTERRELAMRLHEADRRKDEFLAMLAHELRNPLAAVSNAVHLLGLRGDDEEIRRTCVDALGRQTRHLSRLIDDLMDVNRLSQGKLALHTGPVELTGVIRQAVEVVRPLCRARRQRIDFRLPNEPVHVHGDSARLIQAIGNLLNNACKFSNPDDIIQVTLTAEAGRALITVEDSGIGISSDQLEGIFELFQQFHGTKHRENSGLGIGLSLVRRLIELHGGSVKAASPGLGNGSSFVVELPLPAGPRTGHSETSQEMATAPASIKRRVLVVDDNLDTTAAMAGVLRALGHHTLVAHDGLTAVATALRDLPEVVILDIGLPGIDGNEAARRIRSGWPASQPFPLLVALTGWGQPSDRERSTAAGFDRHLVKPVDFEALDSLFSESARL
ncbi:MAG: PAS domain-containing protein [Terrimicrobiaceae bacterium]|nr:PAS domain-containing protein [Terrimicrobiaceae bacterium]